jgi:hypothetical protein
VLRAVPSAKPAELLRRGARPHGVARPLADLRYESFAQGERRASTSCARGEREPHRSRPRARRHDQAIGELEALIAEHPLVSGCEPAHARALPGGAAGGTRSMRTRPRGRRSSTISASSPARAARAPAGDPAAGRVADAAPAAAEQRPVPVSTLVGRRRELEEVTSACAARRVFSRSPGPAVPGRRGSPSRPRSPVRGARRRRVLRRPRRDSRSRAPPADDRGGGRGQGER